MITENVLISFLKKFDEYPFAVEISGKEYLIGTGAPLFKVKLHKDIPLSALTTSTSLALGEAYMDGDLEIEGDLYFALDHFLGQMGKFSTDESALKKIMHSSVSKKNQEKEVQSHYDIGNDFYRLWLDETMSYSCGYFLHEDDTLYQAQVNKVDYILKKLYLKEGMTLLDIGCGWGFLPAFYQRPEGTYRRSVDQEIHFPGRHGAEPAGNAFLHGRSGFPYHGC